LNEPVNWADYINDSWDQGINCSLFISLPSPLSLKKLNSYKKKYVKSQSDISKQFNKNLQTLFDKKYSSEKYKDLELNNYCPLVDKKCENLLNMNYSLFVLSPACIKYNPQTISTSSCTEPMPGKRFNKDHEFNNYRYNKH
jgi:hypothetical protein